MYKSFVYDITKNLELLKNSAQEECKKCDGVAAFLTQRNVIKYQDLIYKFNYFYEEWEKNHQQIDIKKEKNNNQRLKINTHLKKNTLIYYIVIIINITNLKTFVQSTNLSQCLKMLIFQKH